MATGTLPVNQCTAFNLGSVGTITYLRIKNFGPGDLDPGAVDWPNGPALPSQPLASGAAITYSEAQYPVEPGTVLTICAYNDKAKYQVDWIGASGNSGSGGGSGSN